MRIVRFVSVVESLFSWLFGSATGRTAPFSFAIPVPIQWIWIQGGRKL